jgi:hypothetical protein
LSNWNAGGGKGRKQMRVQEYSGVQKVRERSA